MTSEFLFLMILILLNAFFAASEIALITLNDNKIKLMAEEGNKKAKLLQKLLNEPSRFLATIQIGITLAGFLASAFASESFSGRIVEIVQNIGVPIPAEWLKGISVFMITLVLSYFTLVLGELVPKRLAMKKAEQISMFAAEPLNFIMTVTSPFVKLLTASTNFFVRMFGVDPHAEDDRVTEEEIRMMVDVGEEKGTIHEIEKQMINNIFEFNDKTVEDIMTHRVDIVAIEESANFDEAISIINNERYSRIPVFEGSIDNIVGILYGKDLLRFITENGDKEKFNIKSMARKPYFVPASKRTDELFKELQKSKMHMAIIIDEYGGTAGIATFEDLVEEIVGNIFDEDDEEERDFERIDDSTVVINGSANLDDVGEYLKAELPTEEYETLSGFIIGQLGRIPEKDENLEVELNGFIFRIERVEEKRVTKVRVNISSKEVLD
ncbi:hypothetical protein EAL2_c08130 [Peptoclostridium acidaminophilum DSM 3953]|uniref:Uncharacterized protein n=1 Tax=Peptoclostridium acidaminophilum DSM 3953 TaxID=1286171 RepID=W8TE59_PEPAC|nr:hemolysin family protein [Peptoclostridium acidaminophilum]AHM56113.1 hypothetical protein EAL2_c08130 [Peptoclostridium acidaminophilum DSM 3953]